MTVILKYKSKLNSIFIFKFSSRSSTRKYVTKHKVVIDNDASIEAWRHDDWNVDMWKCCMTHLLSTILTSMVSYCMNILYCMKIYCMDIYLILNILRWNMVTNEIIKIAHGNGRPIICQTLYQNIPGTCKSLEVSIKIEEILSRYSPDILFIGEADAEIVASCSFKHYTVVKGTCKNAKKIRMSALVLKSLKFSVETWDLLVPTVTLVVGKWRIVGCYREWAHGGDQQSRSIQQQEARFLNLINKWKKLNGMNTVIVDY